MNSCVNFNNNLFLLNVTFIQQTQNLNAMKAELIQELQLLQQSRANKFTDDLADRILSSVDAVNEKVLSSMSKRGQMLMLLEEKLSFSAIRRLKRKFLKF